MLKPFSRIVLVIVAFMWCPFAMTCSMGTECRGELEQSSVDRYPHSTSHRNARHIVFDIPGGFRGKIGVVPFHLDGVRSSDDGRTDDIIIQVPHDGLVRLAGGNPLAEWGVVSARYDDGGALPIATGPSHHIDPGITALRLITAGGPEDRVLLVVGTEQDAEALFMSIVRDK